MAFLKMLLKQHNAQKANSFPKESNNFVCLQRKLPEQDIAQGSYIALPLTLLLLLAGYNHDKVKDSYISPSLEVFP